MVRDGFVYVVYLGMGDLYKIGRTNNFVRRLSSLRSGNPLIQKVSCVWVHDALETEYRLHKKFERKRVEREIFRLTKKDLKYIADHLSQYTPTAVQERFQSKQLARYYKRYPRLKRLAAQTTEG